MGFLFFFLAFLLGIPLVMEGGWVIVGIGILSLILGYAYTGGPAPLAYTGLGDVFVILFFGLIAVGGVYFLQTGTYSLSAFIAGLQVGFLATILIAINNLRDVEQDRKANKKTLVVRFGKSFARFEIFILIMGTFFLSLFWMYQGQIWAAALPILSFPLGLSLIVQIIKNEPGPIYNRFLAKSAGLHGLFGSFLALGFFLL